MKIYDEALENELTNPDLTKGKLDQSLPIGRCPLFRGMLLHCGMLEVPYYVD